MPDDRATNGGLLMTNEKSRHAWDGHTSKVWPGGRLAWTLNCPPLWYATWRYEDYTAAEWKEKRKREKCCVCVCARLCLTRGHCETSSLSASVVSEAFGCYRVRYQNPLRRRLLACSFVFPESLKKNLRVNLLSINYTLYKIKAKSPKIKRMPSRVFWQKFPRSNLL